MKVIRADLNFPSASLISVFIFEVCVIADTSTKCLKYVCCGRISKLCLYGWCHFLCWYKCLAVIKWWRSYWEDYLCNFQEKHSCGDRKDARLEYFVFSSSGETSRNQIEKGIGKCWSALASLVIEHDWILSARLNWLRLMDVHLLSGRKGAQILIEKNH